MSDTAHQRVAIPAKLRFEVFKRDKFTCQYCGEKAPEVILNCDHMEPVAKGGGNEVINLITSCKKCNGGKGATPLSDHAMLDKQHEMLAELEERRQQLDMMLRWRNELDDLNSDTVTTLAARISKRGFEPNENGLRTIRRWLNRFTFDEILTAIDWSFDAYLVYRNNTPTKDSWEKAFVKVPDTITMEREAAERPYLKRLLYIQGIIRNRTRAKRYRCIEYLEHLVLCGADLDDMERRAKRMKAFDDFEGPYDHWLQGIGRPF